MLGHRRRPRMAHLRPGTAPGTLAAPAEGSPARITVLRYDPAEVVEVEAKTVEEAIEALDRPGVTWINIDGLGEPEIMARLAERLHFHPLAVEDVFNVPQRPKVE